MASNIDSPLVSVVMSAYNASDYIDAAITSILNQSFKDLEFIIINDGSTDDTLKIINGFAKKDKRIKVISRENKGLVASLNEGIDAARAAIIARQDADDISYPTRLQKQFEALDTNVSLAIVGSSMTTIDEKGKVLNQHRVLLNNPELKQELLIRSPFPHGSVMFHKDTFLKAGRYKKDDWPTEDYGLWVRMAPHGAFSNIDEPLYEYRENSVGISAQNAEAQKHKTKKAQDAAWKIRKELPTSDCFNIAQYRRLHMGEYRVDRILDNTLFVLRKSMLHADIFLCFKSIALIITNKILFRKMARKVLVTLKLKHA